MDGHSSSVRTFLPAQNRTYDVGNYVYAEFTRTLKSRTRSTFGAFDFTSKVVASGNKAGGQFGIEQSIGKHVTLAADWFGQPFSWILHAWCSHQADLKAQSLHRARDRQFQFVAGKPPSSA
jgi:hypothetical protein